MKACNCTNSKLWLTLCDLTGLLDLRVMDSVALAAGSVGFMGLGGSPADAVRNKT